MTKQALGWIFAIVAYGAMIGLVVSDGLRLVRRKRARRGH